MPQTRPWLHLRGPSGQASEVPLQDGLIAGRGALGVRCAKKISRQHIMFTLGPDGLSWRVELRGINGAELRREPNGPPIAIQREPTFRDVRLGDTISLAARHPEHTPEIVAAGAPATGLQLARANMFVEWAMSGRVLVASHCKAPTHSLYGNLEGLLALSYKLASGKAGVVRDLVPSGISNRFNTFFV